MMRYYLGKDIYFCHQESKLIFDKDNESVDVSLDHLESSIMIYFISHAGEIISKNSLMDIWNSQYVMEHSLTRVISTLRKKLHDTSKPSLFIKTIPRTGYQYIGLAEIIEIQPQKNEFEDKPETTELSDKPEVSVTESVQDKPETSKSSDQTEVNVTKSIKIKNILIGTGLGAILLISTTLFLYEEDEVKNRSYTPVFEIIDTETLKEQPAVSLNGEVVVYAAREMKGHWFIKLKNLVNSKKWIHRKDNYHLSSPLWLNNEEIIYIQWNANHCSIRKININQDESIQDGHLISNCNASNVSLALAVLDENTILYSASESLSVPMQLISIDINTGAKRHLHNYVNKGHGVYRIYVSPNKKNIAMLSTDDWYNTDISIFEIGKFDNSIWHENINLPLFSVALDDEKIVYKNLKGGFSVAYYNESSQVEQTVPLVFTKPVYSPTYASDGFVFTEGDKWVHQIIIELLSSGDKEVLTDFHNSVVKNPILINDTSILYYSNQTGINQIWRYDLDTKNQEQISNFEHAYFIEGIAADEISGRVAISTNEGIILTKLENNKLIEHRNVIKGIHPSFWDGKLIFSRLNGDINEVFQYDITNDETKLLISNGAYKTVGVGKNLYYSKYHIAVIWKYHENMPDQLIFDEQQAIPLEAWNIKKNILYIGNSNTEKILKVDLDTRKTENISMGSCSSINIISENVCLSTEGKPSINRLLKYTFDN